MSLLGTDRLTGAKPGGNNDLCLSAPEVDISEVDSFSTSMGLKSFPYLFFPTVKTCQIIMHAKT
jgi:hypothetical protein